MRSLTRVLRGRRVLPIERPLNDGRPQSGGAIDFQQVRRAHGDQGSAGRVLQFERVQLGVIGLPEKIEGERPDGIAGLVHLAGDEPNFSRTGGDQQVKVAGQRLLTTSDVEHALAGIGVNSFHHAQPATYLPGGRLETVTVKCGPKMASRKASAMPGGAPSIVTMP